MSWTGSVQGPYPVGNPSAQPDQKFAFPDPATGARDQTFRLIVRPDLWGRQARIRLTNAFGTKPVTFDGVFVGLQSSSAALLTRHQPAGDVRRQDVRHGRARRARSGATRSRCRSCKAARRARRPQARGQLPCRGRERPDDLARQGAARPPTSPRPAPAPKGAVEDEAAFPYSDGLVVLPRRGRHDGAGRAPSRSWRSAIRSPTAPPRR